MFRTQLLDEQSYAAAAQAGFGCPRGIWGAIIGYAMAWTYRSRTAWTLSLLDLQPDDRVLEIGFGPGTAIRDAAMLTARGFVAGIDPSAVMLQQATRRNRDAIHEGRVELRPATMSAIPYPNASFDKIFGTNAIHFSRALDADLGEIHRVLRSGGLAAFSTQPMWKGGSDASALSIGQNLRDAMADAGFHDCRIEQKDTWPRRTVCALGRG
jgi:ubiquinone/menaquinone biosynthesis C-methylase UbiE